MSPDLHVFTYTVEPMGEWQPSCPPCWTMCPPPLQETLSSLCSSFSDRLLHPHCLTERYRRSFLPAEVRLYNHHGP